MTNDELRAWLLLMGFEVVPNTNQTRYIYVDTSEVLRCRVDLRTFISISWLPAHSSTNPNNAFYVTPNAALMAIKNNQKFLSVNPRFGV